LFEWYAGIKRAYGKYLRKLPIKLRNWMVLMRPFTLLLPLCGGWFLVQGSLGIKIPTPNILKTLTALLALTVINAGGNVVNAAYDIEIDKINKPYRPTCTGLVSKEEALALGTSLMCLGVILSFFINYTFHLLCLIITTLTFCYSVPPVRFKKRFFVNNLVQAVIRGFLGVLAAWSIYSPIKLQTVAIGIILTSFIVSAQTSKDISDLPGDKLFNIKTFPVVFGVEKTQKIMTYLIPVPFILLVGFILYGIFPIRMLFGLLLFPLALLIPKTTTTETKIENSLGWAAFYLTMVGFLLLFAFI